MTQDLPIMDVHQVITSLEKLSLMMELHGENPFKARAFTRGARVLEEHPWESATPPATFEEWVENKKILELPGIGQGIFHEIQEMTQTGTSTQYEELCQQTPNGLFQVMKLPGLGPKKVGQLWRDLGIETLGELEYACRENRLVSAKGFGEKTQSKILDSIGFLNRHQGKIRLDLALELREEWENRVQKSWKGKYPEPFWGGSLRRLSPVVTDLQLVFDAKIKIKDVKDLFPEILDLNPQPLPWQDIRCYRGQLKSSLPVFIWFAPENWRGTAEFFSTGGPHWIESVEDFSKNQKDIDLHQTPFPKEEAIFKALGLPFVIPELREYPLESFLGKSPSISMDALVEQEHLKGIFHFHTQASDGANSLREMAERASQLGWTYIGVTEHSQSAGYAGGLKPPEIEKQHKEIDQLNKDPSIKVKILKGIESDILKDGSLDYPEAILKKFDFVIGSIHSILNLPKKEQTQRVLNALDNPHLTMIGHFTGRLLLARKEMELDKKAIFKKAADKEIVIELNASPQRLDLSWKDCKTFVEMGGKISINPDAHHVDHMDFVKYGVWMARKAGLNPSQIINTQSLKEMETTLSS